MSKQTIGDALTRNPMAIRIRVRHRTWTSIRKNDWRLCWREEIENTNEIPARKRNEGKMKSVGVHPSHSACVMGQLALASLPGLSTTIMPTTQRPRKISRHIKRGKAGLVATPAGLNEGSCGIRSTVRHYTRKS